MTDSNHQESKPKAHSSRWWALAGFLMLILVVAASGLLLHLTEQRLNQPRVLNQTFVVEPGLSKQAIIDKLEQAQLIECGKCLWLHVRVFGGESIKAGTYEFRGQLSSLQLLELLRQGKTADYQVTLVEGQTLLQWLDILWAHERITRTLFGDSRDELYQEVSDAIGVTTWPEGLFMPNTYFFSDGSTEVSILKRSYHDQRQALEQLWPTRQADLPLESKYQAVILASIVEKETGQFHERSQIAGVFVNRLNRDMRLETDPTVIYGIDNYDGNITRAHLREKTAYNTYQIKGLPPTPIAAPSLAALEAVLMPQATEALFFVARGDGSHIFSKTYTEHKAAVQEYQLRRRANYRSAPK